MIGCERSGAAVGCALFPPWKMRSTNEPLQPAYAGKKIRKLPSNGCCTPFLTRFIRLRPTMEKSLEIMRKSQRDWNAVFILPMRTLPGKEGQMKTPTVLSVNTFLKIGTLEPLRIRSWSTPWKDSTIVQGKDLGIKHPIRYFLENHTMLHLLLEFSPYLKPKINP